MSRTAIILGTYCESALSGMDVEEIQPFSQISLFRKADQSVPGHALEVLKGTLEGARVLVYSGKLHRYQGLSPYDVAAPVRHAYHAGCDTLVVTTSVTSLIDDLAPGSLAVITDHINLAGGGPLIGPTSLFPDDVPFVDMSAPYDAGLVMLARGVAEDNGIGLVPVVVGCCNGPQYLTRAESRAARVMGCDVVSFSLVDEVVQARALGMRVLGLAYVAARAGHTVRTGPPDEMLEQSSVDMGVVLRGLCSRLAEREG